MGTLSNKERIDGILMRSRQSPPVVDPFADLVPATPRTYMNTGRLLSSSREKGTGGGVNSLPGFAPPSAPAGATQPFNSDDAWNSGPGFRRGRTRPSWWPDELDAYREEDPPQQSQWLEGAPQQSAVSRLIEPQRDTGGNNDVWGEALRDARVNEGMPAEANDTPLDQASLARLRGETAEQEYSPLGEEWGWLDPGAGLVTAAVDTAPDLVMQYFDEDADRRMQGRRRYLAGAAQGALDWNIDTSTVADWAEDRAGADSTMDWITGAPGRERRADVQQTLGDMDARSAGFWVEPDLVIEGERPSLGDRAMAFGEDLWQGPSVAARGARRDAVTGFAMADTLREQGDEAAALEQERRAGQSAATDALITGAGALEAAPGVGLIDAGLMAGRFAGRQPLRALGVADEAMPYWMRATEWSPTATFRGRADEALHDPGMLTREAASARDSALLGTTAVGAGAYAADELMDGEGGDLNQAAGGALVTAGALAGARQLARGRGVDPLADIAPRAEVGAARELDNGTRVYEDGYARTTIEPDGRISHTYQGGYESGGGAAGEAVGSMRAALRALEQDIEQTGRASYNWTPGLADAQDPRLAQFYREYFESRTPPGYVFSESADGTMHLNRVVEADATTAPTRRFEAAIRDPETGRVYRGEDHQEAIDSAPDEAVRARLQAAYDAADEDPSIIGFQVDGQFMGRRDGLAALSERAGRSRQVRIGEQVNRDGSVTPSTPIDWDNPNTRLDADYQEADALAGMPTGPANRGLGNDTANALAVGGVGGGAVGLALEGEAQADNGSGSDGVPMLPVLGAGAGAATLAALSRGRLADDFADSVGMSGGRGARRLGGERAANTDLGLNAPATEAGTAGEQTGLSAAQREALTPDQSYILERRLQGADYDTIAGEMSTADRPVTTSTITVQISKARRRLSDAGMPIDMASAPMGRPSYAAATDEQIIALRDQLRSSGEGNARGGVNTIIAERFGMTPNAVAQRISNWERRQRRTGDPLDAIAPVAAIGGGAALAFSGEADAEDDEDVINRSRYLEARAGEEEEVPEIPALMRAGGALGTGLIARGAAGRIGLRGAAQEVPGAFAAGLVDLGLGGEFTESAALAGATPLIRYAGEELGSRALMGIDDYIEAEGRRSLRYSSEDLALANDPAFQARVREFSMTLPADTPRARVMQGENYSGEILREDEGLPPLVVSDREIAEQGYSRDLPGTETLSPRDEFLALRPFEQQAWMDRQHFRIRQDDWSDALAGAEGPVSGAEAAAARPALDPPADDWDTLDDIAPMPRQYRATPEDIMDNPDRGTLASPARHAQALATIAEEYGVEVARGARGGINGKRTAANIARAARDNPALQAELRRRGLWAAVLTGGGAAGIATSGDPLEGVTR